MPFASARAGLVSQVGDVIPNSVVSRPNDNSSAGINSGDVQGLAIKVTSDWPSIGLRISDNTSGMDTAELRDINDNLIDSVDISGLTSGDSFTFDNVNLTSGNEYVIINGGASHTLGFRSGESDYPYTDSDVEITGNVSNTFDGSSDISTSDPVQAWNDIGNTGFN